MDCGMFYILVHAMIREAREVDGARKGERGKLSRYQILPKFLGLCILAYCKEELSVQFESNSSKNYFLRLSG